MESNENINNGNHLVVLSDSDYEIADGQPDVTGWNVIDIQGQKIGEVDDLLFNPESRKVRYLIVDMEDNDLDLEVERKILIPIGIAELHTQNDDVVLPDVSVEQLSDLPPYDGESLTPETETTIRNVFDGNSAGGLMLGADSYHINEFYDHEHFDDAKFYGSRTDTDVAEESLPFANENTGNIKNLDSEAPFSGGVTYPNEDTGSTASPFEDNNTPPGV